MAVNNNGNDVVAIEKPQWRELTELLNKIAGASGSTKGSSFDKKLSQAAEREADAREENTDALEDNERALNRQTKGIKGQVRSQRELEDVTQKLGRAYISHSKGYEKDYSAYRKLNESLFKTGKSVKEQTSLISGLLEASSLSNESFDKFSQKMVNTSRSFDVLNKNMLKYEHAQGRTSFTHIKTTNDLERAQRLLAKNTDVLEKAYVDTGKKLKEELDRIGRLSEESRTAEEKKVYKYAENAELIGKSNSEIAKRIKGSKAELAALTKASYYQLESAKAVENFKGKIHEAASHLSFFTMGPLAQMAIGFGLLAASIKGAWNQFNVISESGMIGHWEQLKWSQIRLGISFDQAAKLFSEHARMLSVVGDKKFAESVNSAQNALMELGLNTDQSASAAATFMETIGKAGINLKDEKRLNAAVKAQINAFDKMRAVTGVTIDEFKSMQEEMVNSTEIQSMLYGINSKDRDQKINDMMALRQRFTQLGMSAQTAQKAMMSLNELASQKVTTRWEQSAKLQQAMMVAGVANAAEIANIHRKGKRASTSELAQLTSAIGDFTKWQDSQAQGSYMGELIGDVMGEQVSAFKPVIDATREGGLASDAGKKMTDAAVDSNVKLGHISKTMAETKKIISTFESMWNDPLTKIVLGLGAIGLGVAGLMRPLFKMVKSLGSIDRKITAQSASTNSVEDELGQGGGNVEDELGKKGKKAGNVEDDLKKGKKGSPNKRPRVRGNGRGSVSRLAGAYSKAAGQRNGWEELAKAGKDSRSSIDRFKDWGKSGAYEKMGKSVESELGTKVASTSEKMIQGMTASAKSLTEPVVETGIKQTTGWFAKLGTKKAMVSGLLKLGSKAVGSLFTGPAGWLYGVYAIGDTLTDVGSSFYESLKEQQKQNPESLSTLQSWAVSTGDAIVGVSDTFKHIFNSLDNKSLGEMTFVEKGLYTVGKIVSGIFKTLHYLFESVKKALSTAAKWLGFGDDDSWISAQINSIKADAKGNTQDQLDSINEKIQAQKEAQAAKKEAADAKQESTKEIDATNKAVAKAKSQSSAEYIGEMQQSALSASGLYADAYAKKHAKEEETAVKEAEATASKVNEVKVEAADVKADQAMQELVAQQESLKNQQAREKLGEKISGVEGAKVLAVGTSAADKVQEAIAKGADVASGQSAEEIEKYNKEQQKKKIEAKMAENKKSNNSFLSFFGLGDDSTVNTAPLPDASKVNVNPVEKTATVVPTAAPDTTGAAKAEAAKAAAESKTSTSSAKMPKTTEEYLAAIELIMTKNNEINNELCDTSEKQLAMLEALVSSNAQAREEFQRRIGKGNSIDDYLNTDYSRIASMRSGIVSKR